MSAVALIPKLLSVLLGGEISGFGLTTLPLLPELLEPLELPELPDRLEEPLELPDRPDPPELLE
ncbi:hypothetical protein GCM10011386_47920 [Parapedobacter defluvii]|uniref:Secreted protein n=1 Tax=Parapedobacter defluvii TaxID=2045106 RepID=A0ABQ1N0Z0_9SPHI|nr:hypothetical protein GCM10011386_47920 [Parapedobacter defluvii]